jgi:hypothetical protein
MAQALLYSQPRIVAEPGGSLLLIAHVLLSWRAASAAACGGGHGAALRPAAPEYWLKLKRPQAVAEVGWGAERAGGPERAGRLKGAGQFVCSLGGLRRLGRWAVGALAFASGGPRRRCLPSH